MAGKFKRQGVQCDFHKCPAAIRIRPALLFLILGVAGCATRQPPPLPPLPCPDRSADIARLQQSLAEKEVEIASLRSRQQGQNEELQESTAQVARAQVKLRRLATQADAASAIAQAQVALSSLRSSPSAAAKDQQLLQIQRIEAMADTSFQVGDYSSAMDHAAQAEQLVAMVTNLHSHSAFALRRMTQVTFQVPIALRVKVDSHLRREPRGTGIVSAILKANTSIEARAYRGQWLLVEAENGRAGWLYRKLAIAP